METKELIIVFLALFMIHLASYASPSSSSPLKRPLLLGSTDDDHELQKKMVDKDETYYHRNGTASRSDLGVTGFRGGGGGGRGGGGRGGRGGGGRQSGDGSRGGAVIPLYTAGSANSNHNNNHKGSGNSNHLDLILIPIPFGTTIASILIST